MGGEGHVIDPLWWQPLLRRRAQHRQGGNRVSGQRCRRAWWLWLVPDAAAAAKAVDMARTCSEWAMQGRQGGRSDPPPAGWARQRHGG